MGDCSFTSFSEQTQQLGFSAGSMVHGGRKTLIPVMLAGHMQQNRLFVQEVG